ncbi:hypothetical protein ACHAWF_015823 [Thalassiosira exigua]
MTAINGIYDDPNHPTGYRVVRSVDGFPFAVILQDEPDGAVISCGGSVATSGETTTVTMDLSPKGGPKDVVAAAGEGKLVFPDGNAWTKRDGADGVYSDPFHPEGYRVVRMVGETLTVSLQDGPGKPTIELVGNKDEKGDYQIDFSPKGYQKTLAATVKGGKIHFPDGNAWVKY